MVLQVQGHTWARFCCLNVTHLLDLNRNKFSTDGSTQIVQTCLNGANANKIKLCRFGSSSLIYGNAFWLHTHTLPISYIINYLSNSLYFSLSLLHFTFLHSVPLSFLLSKTLSKPLILSLLRNLCVSLSFTSIIERHQQTSAQLSSTWTKSNNFLSKRHVVAIHTISLTTNEGHNTPFHIQVYMGMHSFSYLTLANKSK